MDYKKARIIYNPTSGRELSKAFLPDVLNALESVGYETSAYATTKKGDAITEAKRVGSSFDLIVSMGGDGTVNEIINGIGGLEKRPKLATIPTGTSNDFASALGIKKEFPFILETLKNNQFKSIDIGKMNHRYFINVMGGGNLTDLSYEVPSKLKTTLGQLAYVMKGAEKMVKLRPYHITLETNGHKFSEEVLLFLVSNSNIVGGFHQLVPYANLDDGLFDVFLLKNCPLTELTKVINSFLSGHLLSNENIIHFQTNTLHISSNEIISINIDGELGGVSPCSIQNLPKHLDILIP